jgi:hypothetical protein
MDMDIKELEDLAQDTHADLQEPSKKAVDSPAEAPGHTDDTRPSEGTPTQDVTTTASEVTESMNSKVQMDRETLAEAQKAVKINQDLFY